MAKKLSNVNVVRAWKDASYRNSLSAAQRAMLPASPAGLVEVDDAELGMIGGGDGDGTNTCRTNQCTFGCQAPDDIVICDDSASHRLAFKAALAAPRVS